MTVRLAGSDGSRDEFRTRIGFREARFTPAGFMLNGEHIKLRGLNRHQTFPYVGGAMPARVQRRDAWILRRDLHCNIVRTSHYPQSPDFLDACDELGPAGARRDPRLAAHRRQGVAGPRRAQRGRDDPPRLEPSVHRAVGRAHQRIAGQSRFLHAHQRARALARRCAADRRHPLPAQFGVARRRVHHERFRLSAAAAESSAVSEHRIQRPHVLHQALRQRGRASPSTSRATPASTTSSRPTTAMPAASAGAPSITTRTPISARATTSATTASAIFSAFRNRPRISTSRSAIPRKRSCWRRGSSGRRATGPKRAVRARCRSSPTATI